MPIPNIQRCLLVGTLLLTPACNNSKSAAVTTPEPPSGPQGNTGNRASRPQLVFRVQPGDGLGGDLFANPVTIEVQDDRGRLLQETVQVTLRIHGKQGVPLAHHVAETQGGLAQFDRLRVFGHGDNLRLEARAGSGLQARSALSQPFRRGLSKARRHLIVMIADGMGYQHVAATRSYIGKALSFEAFDSYAMSTWDLNTEAALGKGYDPARAWSEFSYPILAVTDSASSATAMFCGHKTHTGMIGVSTKVSPGRLLSISELAQANGLGSGLVTSVPINHATPAAWATHNISRGFYPSIADELLFGAPGRTGPNRGGVGPAYVRPDVVLGGGHPLGGTSYYLSKAHLQRARASADWEVLDPYSGTGSTAQRLLQAARRTSSKRLLGLFGGSAGSLPFALHDGSGRSPHQPTLRDMTAAALSRLEQKPRGFVLMVEGGAVDWAGHENHMSKMVGEMQDFDRSVAEVIRWIEDSGNQSSWSNTTLIVTGDHETGYLTAGPGVFADQPMGAVTAARMLAEEIDTASGYRASWDDQNQNQEIDQGEAVYWAWNSGGHSNSLIPCFIKGVDAKTMARYATGLDPKRGRYLDNTDLYKVLDQALRR